MKDYGRSNEDPSRHRSQDTQRERHNAEIRVLQAEQDAHLRQSGVAEKAYHGILGQHFREINPLLSMEACRFGVRLEVGDDGRAARVMVTMTWDGGRDSWWNGQLLRRGDTSFQSLNADALTAEEVQNVIELAKNVYQAMAQRQAGHYYLETL